MKFSIKCLWKYFKS